MGALCLILPVGCRQEFEKRKRREEVLESGERESK
jgi:hypothetical protein